MESACAGCFFVMILAHLYRFFETDVLSSQHNGFPRKDLHSGSAYLFH